MLVGMDFGTTNTGAAYFDGSEITLFPLDPTSRNPSISRSAIYMTRSGDFFLGSAALKNYFEQNVGRPSRYTKVRVGEIAQVFAELPVFYRDVFVYQDEFSPGRLFTSVKTALRNREYFGTAFLGAWYTASDLVAIFLSGMRMQIEKYLGAGVEQVVLGRPVRFSSDPEEDRIAEGRLLDAAFKAGFQKVYLEYEPIAAALSYERTLHAPETVLVFDFGGGTLDFTIMRLGVQGEQRVLATGGIPIAGDIFDQRLFRVAIPRHLGEGDEFISNGLHYPIPSHIFDTLSQPHEILSLNSPQSLEMLRAIHQSARNKDKTGALLQVVSSNYALLIFDRIERAKQQLSKRSEASVIIQFPKIFIDEHISRSRFEHAIAREYEAIRSELLLTLDRSGLHVEQIDRVIRTGGSSQIPMFINLLQIMFGNEKVQAIDVFSSVTSGLAVRAYQIERGLVELPAYTPESAMRSWEGTARSDQAVEARQVDLELVFKRIRLRQEYHQGRVALPERIVLVLGDNGLHALAAPEIISPIEQSTKNAAVWSEVARVMEPNSRALLARLDDYALLATNQARLISIPMRDLYLAGQTGAYGIASSLPLEPGEFVSAMISWRPDDPEKPLIGMLTSSGQGRAFDASLLAEHIAKRPYFQLERRYSGVPLVLLHTAEHEVVLAGTDRGRAARAYGGEITVQPYDLIRVRKNELLSTGASVATGELVLAVGANGDSLKLDPQSLPAGGTPATRGHLLHRNFPLVGFLQVAVRSGLLVGLTLQGRLYPIDWDKAIPGNSSSGQSLVHLATGDRLIACLRVDDNGVVG